jgi:hypothetical protein
LISLTVYVINTKEVDMSFAIMWLGKFAGSLLLTALLVSLASLCKKTLWQKVLSYLVVLIFAAGFTATAAGTWIILQENIQPRWLFWYTLILTLAYITCSIIIVRYGLAGEQPEAVAARSWPRLMIAAAFAVVTIGNTAFFFYTDSKIVRELMAIRSETNEKLKGMMPTRAPDTQNARLVYEQAAKALGADKDFPKWFRETPPDIAKEEMKDFLTKRREATSLIYKASGLPLWGMDIDTSQSAYLWPLPSFTIYRNLAYLLYVSACDKTSDGDTTGALQDLALIETMSGHIMAYPSLLSLMINVALDDVRIRGVEHVLANNSRPLTGLIPLPVKAHTSGLDIFRKTLALDGLAMTQGLAFMLTSDDRLFAGIPFETSIYRVFFAPYDIASDKKKNEFLTKPAGTYEEFFKNIKQSQEIMSAGGGFLTRIAGPSHDNYFSRIMSHEARRALADTGLAVAAYKSAKGGYPEKLEALVPAYIDRIPLDPFTGKPLMMRPVKGGLELYCAGKNSFIKTDSLKGPVNFFIGKEAYEEFRVQADREARLKKDKPVKKEGDSKAPLAPDAVKK